MGAHRMRSQVPAASSRAVRLRSMASTAHDEGSRGQGAAAAAAAAPPPACRCCCCWVAAPAAAASRTTVDSACRQ